MGRSVSVGGGGPVDPDVPERYRVSPDFVPKDRYVDPGFLELELERLFPHVWLNACRLEEVPDVGCFVELIVGDDSIVVVRTAAPTVKAYYNSCRHRGTRLLAGRGRVGEIRCPFHAWRWNLDGTFKHRPDDENFSPLSVPELCLAECAVDTWGGWVFVNMSPDPEPLLDYLDPLPERLQGFGLEDMRYVWHKRFVLRANWKTAIDAFIEAYHVAGTHPQFLRPHLKPTTPATMAEMRLLMPSLTETHGRHGRTLKQASDPGQAAAVEEAMADAGVTPLQQTAILVEYQLRELQSLNTEWDRLALDRLAEVELPPDPAEQHRLYLRTRRELAAAAGATLPDLDRQQIHAGAYDWHIFPNTILLVTGNVGSLLGYRVLPRGHDPDSCVFDAWSMQIYAPGTVPAVELQEFNDWRDGQVGELLGQDFANLHEVTVGMHSRSFAGLRINQRQETTIPHHHSVADRFLFGA